MSADPFNAVMGDRRGSGRLDPPDPRWWLALAKDPRWWRVLDVLNDCYARGLRWMATVPARTDGPWRLYTKSAPDARWTWGDSSRDDLVLSDEQRDRIEALWEAGELTDRGSLSGWLWELP